MSAHISGARAAIAIVLLAGATATSAQSAGDHTDHQDSHAAPPAQATPDTPQSGMDHGATPAKSDPQPAAPDTMQGMDHGDMNMQGGPVPADARDPHAYSGGYTLEDGQYALAGPRQLRMADEHNFASLLVDRLERVDTRDATFTTYDAQAWFGRDYNRFIIKAEGDYADGDIAESSTELLYGRAIASYWDAQVGVRHDTGEGPDRNWLAFGVQGLAPYWFELDTTAYVGSNGRTALTVEAEYELLITQRLVLQPHAELALYGKSDRANGIGSGLTDARFGLRLRYEFSRQFAPYVGVEWANKFGQTADFARDEGAPTRETRYVLGVRFWF